MRLPASLAVVLLMLAARPAAPCQVVFRDDFEDLSAWKPVTSHGDASRLTVRSDQGRTGRGLLMDFSFLGHMGSVAVERKLSLELPARYQISFALRGKALPNNLIIRLIDSLDNVWVVMRAHYQPSPSWTTVTIHRHQVAYGWGPAGGGGLRSIDRIMLMWDVVEGGAGKVWLDDLAIEALQESNAPPRVTVSSFRPGHAPRLDSGGRRITGWEGGGDGGTEWLALEFPVRQSIGGLVIDWNRKKPALAFNVFLSPDGRSWTRGYRATNGGGVRNSVPLPDADVKFVKLEMLRGVRGKGFGLDRLEIRGPEFSFSNNEFFSALAAESPPGFYPKYFLRRQAYWTVVGVAGDENEALINDHGMIETGRLGFSLEPFLFLGGELVTWHDVQIDHSLAQGDLPIPTVLWKAADSLLLRVTALATGAPGKSTLLLRYRLEHQGAGRGSGRLFVAARPFQVNPPWQTFTIVGGVSRIDSVECGPVLRVNRRTIIPLTPPSAMGAAEFDQGDVTMFLRRGVVPPSRSVRDHAGFASAAMAFDFDVRQGERQDVILAVPFSDRDQPDPPAPTRTAPSAFFDSALACSTREWESRLGTVVFTLPEVAAPVARTIRSNLAFIQINADGPALQPGSRTYERSWIRDGALTSAALLQMGISAPVRAYLDWYATFQFPDGAIPCVVEDRGPEPIPEHDSHGQFIYAVAEYFRFTQDTAWLRGKWDAVAKTVRHLQALRSLRKTDTYRRGTPQQRACFGLVPESISHEGYTPKPMHSYWDNFFVLRGLKDAAMIAEVLARPETREIAAERDDFSDDLGRSIRLAMRNAGVAFIPGCVELGDFSGLSTTVAVTPCGVLDVLPEPALTYTFDESYRTFLERKNGRAPWDAYLPYEARFIGAFVQMGWKERAFDILTFLMNDRRPAAWNGWGEVVWRDPSAPRSIGDMPHSWAASDFIRSVRSMFVYERDSDTSLVVAAGIPEEWLQDPAGLEVRNLPTVFGAVSYSIRGRDGTLSLEVSGPAVMPPGGLVIPPLRRVPARQIRLDGHLLPDTATVVLRHLPATLEFVY